MEVINTKKKRLKILACFGGMTLIILLNLAVITSFPANDKTETEVADKNTRFHRLYVLGNGDNDDQDESFWDDYEDLREDLESEDNQAPGSSSNTLETPTKAKLKDEIDKLKQKAKPGDEVTFFFSGHGGNRWFSDTDGDEPDDWDEHIRINKNERITDDELAEMLSGFEESVTLVVILDCCHGGGFTGGTKDLQESDHLTVIGVSDCTFIEPGGIWRWFYDTFTEYVEWGAGNRNADENEDEAITGDELKKYLKEKGWNIGSGGNGEDGKGKKGKSGCDKCSLSLPSLRADRVSGPGGCEVSLFGQNFAFDSLVSIVFVQPDMTWLTIGSAQTDDQGFFATDITIPIVPNGQYLIIATDGEENEDWIFFWVLPEGKQFFAGVSSVFYLQHDVATLYVRVVKETYSNLIYDIEILPEIQEPTWDIVEAIDAPEGWKFEKIDNGVRFYTETNPLIRCQRKKFTFRIDAKKISWYIRIHITDQNHQNVGIIVSTRWWLYRYYIV